MQDTNKQIYINLIVKDLEKATKFYQTLGFELKPEITNQDASGLAWSENIAVMLLSEKFAKNFTEEKEIADNKKTVSAIYCLSMNSKEEVNEFLEKAKNTGARIYENEYSKQYDFMYSREVEDLDGYIWEPLFMDVSKFPQE